MKKLYYWKFTTDLPFYFDIQFFPDEAFNPVMDFHNSIHLNLILDQGMDGKAGNTQFHLNRYDLQITAPWELHGANRIEKKSASAFDHCRSRNAARQPDRIS